MPKVITYGGDTKIGAYKLPDRKKVCLCIEKGNEITIYGTFNNEYSANNFIDELGRCNKQLKIVNPSDTCEYAASKERGEER